MKALFSFLSCLIMLALFTRCADDELDGPSDGLPDKGLVVRLSTGGGLETKTTLNSTGAYHHVQEVWAVLYKLNASGSPDNLNDYTYISHQRLMVNETTPWDPYGAASATPPTPPVRLDGESDEDYEERVKKYDEELKAYSQQLNDLYGGSYGNGNIQQKDFELKVDVDGMILPPATYRVLCIGLDEESKTLYGLKKDENNLSDIFADGNTLADAVATITDIKQAFEGELFAGWAEFQFEPDNLNIVEVEMKRRVAGVLCYVTDIPKVITTDNNKEVKGIRLALYTGENVSEDGSAKGLNNQIHLCRLEGEERTNDFGTLTDDASWSAPDEDGYTTLAYYALPNQKGDNADTYQFDWEGTMKQLLESEGISLKNNSLLMGAYVIPIKKGAEPTLVVQLIGGDNVGYAEGDSPQEVEIGQTVNGEVLATFNATRSGVEGGDVTSYDILPNYIYHIGNKPEPDGTDKDEPVSLLGQKITVTPEEWTKHEIINVEYPSVPIKLGIDYPYEQESYIFDCISHEFEIRVKASVLHDRWRLTVEDDPRSKDNPDYENGIYIRTRETNEYDKYEYDTSYESDDKEKVNGADVTILLTDFVSDETEKCWSDPANDYREMTIRLENLDNTSAEDVVVKVRQYNAFIRTVDGENRGFTRFDMGTYRYSDGSIGTLAEPVITNFETNYGDGLSTGWGFWQTVTGNIFTGGIAAQDDYDGKVNYNAVNKNRGGFAGSAFQKSYLPLYEVENVSGEKKERSEFWYLPASYEIEAFLKYAKDHSFLNAKAYSSSHKNYRYWTSQGQVMKTWAYYIDGNEVKYNTFRRGYNEDLSEKPNRDNQFFVRQCCHVP